MGTVFLMIPIDPNTLIGFHTSFSLVLFLYI